MAGIKISALPAAASSQLTDLFPAVQTGTTKKETLNQVFSLFQSNGTALSSVNDTNVTATLGGSPTTALLNPASLTMGWAGTLSGTRGGTGVNNGASTITLGGSLTTSGAFASTFTMTNTTAVTFPTSGTLATTAQIPTVPLTWAANASSSISAAVGNGYILTSGSATTVTLPTTFAAGQILGVAGQGAAFTVALGASTNIKAFGNTYTTSFSSTNNSDVLVLIGAVANTTWSILNMTSTGFTAS